VSLFHERGSIDSEDFNASGTLITGRIPPHLMQRFQKYLSRTNGRRIKAV
jgi:hypothetical protein